MIEDFTREKIYDAWAPSGCLWSPWVKPVLFATMGRPPAPAVEQPAIPQLSWAPPVTDRVALVLDLPREEGVLVGLELAARGYRPVPLYNAVPEPAVNQLGRALAQDFDYPIAVVDVLPIQEALWRGTLEPMKLFLPLDAPPAFLLDANRRVGRMIPAPGSFDNRSVSFTTDFPSGIFLRTQGISRAVLVQRLGSQPQPDLAHTLRRWQEAGVKIELKRLDLDGPPELLNIERPSRFKALWYRMWVGLGLKRNELGGYGGIIGVSSGG